MFVIAFLPVYLVLMFPCVLFQLCRKGKSGENVVKKFFNMDDNGVHGAGDIGHEELGGDGKCDGEDFPLTGGHLKSKLNNRRASSIDDENETKGK